jgi:hypothetical protein
MKGPPLVFLLILGLVAVVSGPASAGTRSLVRPRGPGRAPPQEKGKSGSAELATVRAPGRLAQLGEHQLDKLGVTGSSPVPPTKKPR